MKETIDAIYENGLLRPLGELRVLEGQRIRVTVETVEREAEPLAPDSTPPFIRVRKALSGCAGSLAEDLDSDREDRV